MVEHMELVAERIGNRGTVGRHIEATVCVYQPLLRPVSGIDPDQMLNTMDVANPPLGGVQPADIVTGEFVLSLGRGSQTVPQPQQDRARRVP